MVAGIIFQLVSITAFVALAADFALRVSRQIRRAGSQINKCLLLLGAAVAFSLVLIYIRSVYRTIELLHGWTSSTMRNEKLLIGLDAAMMVPAVMIFNVFHPSYLLPRLENSTQYMKADAMGLNAGADQYQVVEQCDRELLLRRI
ncbi:hypothetical protein BDW71DRAFT_49492 [Aspergillus fruticulosus]